jgi:hypothetical protein
MNYRHTQIGYATIMALGVAIVLTIERMLSTGPAPPMIALLVALLACLLTFTILTIEILDGFLSWRFGLGILSKNVPLSSIVRATQVRTTLLQGWGIHRTSGGWLYNVSGFEAVEFELKDGKRWQLGTDEPEELVQAVSVHLGH